ncbi:eCIS core domain-containing protein [Nostoc sp. UIC 10890]
MYRKPIFQKVAPSLPSTPINKEIASSPSYGSLSSVVQRVQQDPNSVSGDERQELESAIGSRSTREILAGKQTSWVPEFQGISAQLWGNSGQVAAPIQAKLTIGEAGDKYEQEADRVAKDVVQQINTPQTNALPKEDSAQIQPNTLQRQQTDEEELQLKQLPEMVQRREAIAEGEASRDLESAINSTRGSGQPLDASLQQSMGQAMGTDFSGVRVHTDVQADQLNQSIQAKAFTTGKDLFFRQGEYQPGSRGGQELIAHELTHVVQQNGGAVQRYLDLGSQNNIIQRKNEAIPQNFGVTGVQEDNNACKISTTKTWQSSTGDLTDLDDVEMREHVTFDHNPAIDIPSYPIVAPTVPGMVLTGNLLTKVAGSMQSGSGTDTHSGAGYAPSFTYGGIQNLTKGVWQLIGTQVYEYRDRGAAGAWQPLHDDEFTIDRTMSVNPTTHQYELSFSKTGPNCTAAVTTPIEMQTTEAMQVLGAARPDQTPLWNALDNEITQNQEHIYETVGGSLKLVNGMNLPITYQVTQPAPNQAPNRALFAPYETLTPDEYNPLIANINAGLDTIIEKYMGGLAAMPARVIIIISKATGGVRQQACYIANGVGGPTLRILFRFGKFAQVDPNDRDTSMAGRESKRGGRGNRNAVNRNERWQKATVIHEMGHMLHAFNDMSKFQAATVDNAAATAAAANIQPEMFKIANVNQQILNALAAQNYKGKWNYAQANPAEVVAEVWTALMHGRNVPRGLAAVYLAYGGMRNTTINNQLSRLFPHNTIPAFNQPEDALNYIP